MDYVHNAYRPFIMFKAVMILRPGLFLALWISASAQAEEAPLPPPKESALERTCFQTGRPWSGAGNLPADVAIVYGIGPDLAQRAATWKQNGYRIHLMTGASWGSYQDYLYGRFDGVNHEDEAQTQHDGTRISHGGDVYYMCPGTNYGRFLCVGIQRALDAGVEAVHLEEPEFWVRGGWSEGFKREWRSYYHEDWQAPDSSADAQWRASKLKYFLYRRALQQVFDYVQDYNRRTGKTVRCYVPTHSLLNYAHWRIVSPESSLARLNGCDGYIAQVWTGTSRTPNLYRGQLRERTFETAFLEYGVMQNLVTATGRRVWYLNDPVEDNPNHDWEDYRTNWESTLVASLLQPEVWRYEIAPWPERVFGGRYPRPGKPGEKETIPPAYATELQVVMNTLNDMNQPRTKWEAGTAGVGLLVSDSLMFQRGGPGASDEHLSQVYGLALPLLKRGVPVTPVQLENATIPHYLDRFRLLLLTYHGQKPLSPEVHGPLADWVKRGGALVVVDDDTDAFNQVREWWNSGGLRYATPRAHLFEQLALEPVSAARQDVGQEETLRSGKGVVIWRRENPAALAADAHGDERLVGVVKSAAAACRLRWSESNSLLLRRGPYIVAAGLDESIPGDSRELRGRFINLFDPELRLQTSVKLTPGARLFLLDLDKADSRKPRLLAAAGRTFLEHRGRDEIRLLVEGVPKTPGILLFNSRKRPGAVTLDGQPCAGADYSPEERLLRVRFENQDAPRTLRVTF